MTARVIQGLFLGGQPKLPQTPIRMSLPIQAKSAVRLPAAAFARHPVGPPSPAFAAWPPGPPAPAFVGRSGAVQRQGGGGAFAVEAGQLGLAAAGGRPLPESVRGKMEAALGADFSGVRVHVGPQAERIGAIAFTLGSDIYFAPGRYQPETVHGQQLLGHELAHVVQQRAGRVKNPLGSGLAVVQDHALEAEADRLGRHAAMHRVAAQAKMSPGAAPTGRHLVRASVQRQPARFAGCTGVAVAAPRGRPEMGGSGAVVQRLTALAYNPIYNRRATDTIATLRHQRVQHNGTQRLLASYLSGYNSPAAAPGNCNHYIPYNWVANAVDQQLAGGTVAQGVAWMTGTAFPGAQTFYSSTDLGLNVNPGWNVVVGAVPQPNIPVAAIVGGVNTYSEIVLNQQTDDLIFNLANDPRNLFYWPNSTGDNGGQQVDNPTGAGGIALHRVRARLANYRATLQGLGLNV